VAVKQHHAALDRAGPDDRDLDDQVLEALGFMRGSMLICARLSIWKTPTVSALSFSAPMPESRLLLCWSAPMRHARAGCTAPSSRLPITRDVMPSPAQT